VEIERGDKGHIGLRLTETETREGGLGRGDFNIIGKKRLEGTHDGTGNKPAPAACWDGSETGGGGMSGG
jgi:hypothetical protein